MVVFDVNYWAVLVSGVIGMLIGALWYSPLLFGNLWMRLSGISSSQIDKMKKSGIAKSYFWAFVMTLIGMYVLAIFINYAGVSRFISGMGTGILAWLGFIIPILLNDFLWGGKSFKLFLLNAAHHLIVIAIGGGILAVWQ